MPRLPINYANIQIYRFICNDINIINTYVGSTTDWNNRKRQHKCNCINLSVKQHNLKMYQIMRENGGWDNWNMILIENYPCNSRREAEQREQYWKEHYNDDMGMNDATLNNKKRLDKHKKYRDDNSIQLLNKKKEYYQINKEAILLKVNQYRKDHKEEINQKRRDNQAAKKLKQDKN
jgi:hypothetical protein